jgi:Bacterial mobilisation protein (MobC)
MTSRRDPNARAIQFFVDDKLHEAWSRQARSCNTTLTGFIRSHLPGVREIEAMPMVSKNQQISESVDMLAALRAELKGISNNVNQTAKVLNSHAKHNGQLPTQLDLREEYEILEKTINRVAREIRVIGEGLIGGQ